MTEFDTVIWESVEEDGGDELRLLYSSELDIVALQDVTHDVTVFLEPQAMASLTGAFLAWSHNSTLT